MTQLSLLACVISLIFGLAWIVLLSCDYYRAAKVTGWIALISFIVWFVTSLKIFN